MLKNIRTFVERDIAILKRKLNLGQIKFSPKSFTLEIFLKNKFSFGTKQSEIIISKDEQRAVVSYLVIQYIRQFKGKTYIQQFLSIRQKLIDHSTLQKLLDEELEKIGFKGLSFEDIGVSKQCINDVLKGFQMTKGSQFNWQIFSQQQNLNKPACHESLSDMNKDVIFEAKGNQQAKKSQKSKDVKQNLFETPIVQKDSNLLILKPSIVFNPTLYTARIFSQIFFHQSLIISGSKSIGKSFSYALYDYLSSFIIKCRANASSMLFRYTLYSKLFKCQFTDVQARTNSSKVHETDDKNKFIKAVTLSERQKKKIQQSKRVGFFKIKKLFYINILDKQLQQIFQLIKMQAYQINQSQLQKMSEQFKTQPIRVRIKMFIMRITTYYKKIGIMIYCVIDEAYAYYSSLHKLGYWRDLYRINKDLQSQKDLTYFVDQSLRYSQIMKILSVFPQLILNSSRSIEPQFHQQFDGILYYNFYDRIETAAKNLKIQHSFHMDTQIGQYEIYKIFWFQIEAYMINYATSQEIRNIYALFVKTFNLSDKDNFIRWNYDVRPDDLRIMMAQMKIKNSSIYFDMNNSRRIEEQFLQLKQNVQKKHQQNIEKSLRKIVTKSLTNFENWIRIQILIAIRRKAYTLMQQQSYYKNKKKSFSIIFSDIFKQTNYRYFQKEIIKKQIQIILYQFNLGILKDKKQLDAYIIYHPRTFIKYTKFLYEPGEYLYKTNNIYAPILDHSNTITGGEAGDMLDTFLSHLFARGHFVIMLKNLRSQTQQTIFYMLIDNGFTFRNWNQARCLEETFSQMIQSVRNLKEGTIISGSHNVLTDEGIDFVSMSKSLNVLNLITIDASVSQVSCTLNEPSSQVREKKISAMMKILQLLSQSNFCEQTKIQFEKLTHNRVISQKIRQEFQQWLSYKEIELMIDQIRLTNDRELKTAIISLLIQGKLNKFDILTDFIGKIIHKKIQYPTNLNYSEKDLESQFYKRHHFCIPLQKMILYNGPEDLHWHHILLVPSFRCQQYKKSLNKVILNPLSWNQCGKSMKLEFSISPIDFDEIRINQRQVKATSNIDQKEKQQFKYYNEQKILFQSMKQFTKSLVEKVAFKDE